MWKTNLNKKTWEVLNVYFSNKLQFERKLYYHRPGLVTRETKIRVVGLRYFIFWLKRENPLALCLCEKTAQRFWFFLTIFAQKGYYTFRKQKTWTPPRNFPYSNYFWHQISVFWFFTENFDFLDYILPKRVFPIVNRKVNSTIEFSLFELI